MSERESNIIVDENPMEDPPVHCPWCSHPLRKYRSAENPAEEEEIPQAISFQALSAMRFARPAEIHVRPDGIAFCGGDSPYTKADPYLIEAYRVRTAEDALDWMAHIATKLWAHGGDFHHALARELGRLVRGAKKPGRRRRPGSAAENAAAVN